MRLEHLRRLAWPPKLVLLTGGWKSAGMEDGFDHAEGVEVGEDVVDAVDHDAVFAGEGGDGDGGPVAQGGGWVAEDAGDEGFAGCAEEERAVGGVDAVKGAEQGEVVVEGFSEADAGVVDDAFSGNAGLGESVLAFLEKGGDFRDDVGVVGGDLHCLRSALHVHDDDAAVVGAADVEHGGISAQACDVVDDVGPGIESGGGDGGLGGVDGDEAVPFRAKRVDDGDSSADFLRGVDRGSAGAGGFTADIDDGRAVADHVAGVCEGAGMAGVFAAIGEGIRGHVEDAHDHGPGGEVERESVCFPNCGHWRLAMGRLSGIVCR